MRFATPHFLIIGSKRAGTTALFNYLMQNDALSRPEKKELNTLFLPKFNKRDYISLFPSDGLSGEATPIYSITEIAAKRIIEVNPKIKIILLMREPVSRILSEYPKQLSLGMVRKPLSQLIDEEIDRLNKIGAKKAISSLDYFYKHKVTSYLLRGHYADILEVWNRHVVKNNILSLQSELLFSKPEKTTGRVFDFLGIPRQSGLQYGKINTTALYVKDREFTQAIEPAVIEKMSAYFAQENKKLWRRHKQEIEWQAPKTFDGY